MDVKDGRGLKRERGDLPGGPVAKTTCPQWRGLGSVPTQGTRFHMLQLGVHMSKLKDLMCCN